MLPEILSNSLASLQAGRTRYTVSALLEFNREGILTSQRFNAWQPVSITPASNRNLACPLRANAGAPALMPPL